MNVVRLAQADAPSADRRSRAATFSSRFTDLGVVIITVAGEIDASNTHQLVGWVSGHLDGVRRVVLDCGGVTFFAVDGFSALQRINVMCARVEVVWTLVPSAPVSRVMQLCNPGGCLVPVGSVDATVIPLRTVHPPRLRLVRDN